MTDVYVEDPATRGYRKFSRAEAIAHLETRSPNHVWMRRLANVLLWVGALGYVAAVVWAVGPMTLWGVLGGLMLAWAWRTRR